MSDNQIEQILESNRKQSEELRKFREEQQKFNDTQLQFNKDTADAYGKHALFVKDSLDKVNEKVDNLSLEVAPIVKLSKDVQGADRIGMWILKFLIGGAALLTALGTILYYVRKALIS